MKTINKIFKHLLLFTIAISIAGFNIAQEKKDSFDKTYELAKDGNFTFHCYDTDLKINTWDKNEVKLHGEIIYEGGSEEDQQKLLKVFKDPKSSSSNNSLDIKTNLAKSTIMIGPFKKITLVDGKTIRVKKFKVKYELWMPKTAKLLLNSKYNKVLVADILGDAIFRLYETKLTLSSFNVAMFDMKYSNGDIGTGNTATFQVYESKFQINNIENINTRSKYSKFDIKKADKLIIDSYEDHFNVFDLSSDFIARAKYTDIEIRSNANNVQLDSYECNLKAQNINALVFNSKYSTVKALNIDKISSRGLYEAKIDAGIVNEFYCAESKYDKFNFVSITKTFDLKSAYESDINIEKAEATLERFSGNFKYGNVRMPLDPKLEFSLDFETNYGKVNFPKGRVRINSMSDKDGSKYSFEGSTVDNPTCKIRFKSYETDFYLE